MSSPAASKRTKNNPQRVTARRSGTFLIIIGSAAFSVGFFILLLTFYPVIREELRFRFFTVNPTSTSPDAQNNPVDTTFGIVIPKIGANAHVVADVDPYDSRVYQRALTKGVAHAKGTSYPGEPGNVFLFSHSSANFYEATRYNSVFYLLHAMEKGDVINLYYNNRKFRYIVTQKITVAPSEISYLTNDATVPTLTLMTCWPPGTTFWRLLVLAVLKP